MCQRLGSRKNYWDFAVLGKVIRKRGRFMVFDSFGGDRGVAVICFALITSKSRLTSPSGVFCRGVMWQVA
jgi:hypothetical protein